jgi:hypothetical protein
MMPSFLESLEKLNLPKLEPLRMPESVKLVAERLGVELELTCRAAPEQYAVTREGRPCGYIRARHGGMSVSYPDAGGDDLYEASIDGFAGFTDHEREAKLLLALGLIAAKVLAE